MENCRILTPGDAELIPSYLQILRNGLDEIEPFYTRGEIANALALYTPNYVANHLRPNKEKRFVGHFKRDSLDGILIEGFDQQKGEGFVVNRALINWVIAQTKGEGIGTALIRDCIERAEEESKDVVSLVVSRQNQDAIRLYKKLGFKSDVVDSTHSSLMHFFINPRMDPANYDASGQYKF